MQQLGFFFGGGGGGGGCLDFTLKLTLKNGYAFCTFLGKKAPHPQKIPSYKKRLALNYTLGFELFYILSLSCYQTRRSLEIEISKYYFKTRTNGTTSSTNI